MTNENNDGVSLTIASHPCTGTLWQRLRMFFGGYKLSDASIERAEIYLRPFSDEDILEMAEKWDARMDGVLKAALGPKKEDQIRKKINCAELTIEGRLIRFTDEGKAFFV